MAQITAEAASEMKAEDAVSFLKQADFCLEGGRSFGGEVMKIPSENAFRW